MHMLLLILVAPPFALVCQSVHERELEYMRREMRMHRIMNPSRCLLSVSRRNHLAIWRASYRDGIDYSWTSNMDSFFFKYERITILFPRYLRTSFNSIRSYKCEWKRFGNLTCFINVEELPVVSAIPSSTQLMLRSATLNFANTSLGADSYYWDFGDGDWNSLSDPSHVYSDIIS